SLGFHKLLTTRDHKLGSILRNMTNLAGPITIFFQLFQKVVKALRIDGTKQLMTQTANRFRTAIPVQLFGAAVPLEDSRTQLPSKDRFVREFDQCRLSDQYIR